MAQRSLRIHKEMGHFHYLCPVKHRLNNKDVQQIIKLEIVKH